MGMVYELSSIREGLRQADSKRKRGQRYPVELRERALAYLARREAAGVSAPDVAAELRVSYWTLWGWRRPPRPQKNRVKAGRLIEQLKTGTESSAAVTIAPVAGAWVPVDVIASSTPSRSSTIVVRAACGVEVAGLDVEQIAELIRRLS